MDMSALIFYRRLARLISDKGGDRVMLQCDEPEKDLYFILVPWLKPQETPTFRGWSPKRPQWSVVEAQETPTFPGWSPKRASWELDQNSLYFTSSRQLLSTLADWRFIVSPVISWEYRLHFCPWTFLIYNFRDMLLLYPFHTDALIQIENPDSVHI